MHFGLFARPIIGFQAGFYFAPSPPHPSSYHFFNGPFLINSSWLFQERTSGARLVFHLSPPGALFISSPFEGGGELNRGRGLIWFRKDDGSLTTIFIWNYPPLPLKNQKISNNAGKGGTGNLIRGQPNNKKWRSSRTRRLEVMQPRIRIKSELLECRERLWETKARNDQKSNICQLQIVHCIKMKISNRHHSRWPRF